MSIDHRLLYPFVAGPFCIRSVREEDIDALVEIDFDPVARGGWELVEPRHAHLRPNQTVKTREEHRAAYGRTLASGDLGGQAVVEHIALNQVAGYVVVRQRGERLEADIFLSGLWQRQKEQNGTTILAALLDRLFWHAGVETVCARTKRDRPGTAIFLENSGFVELPTDPREARLWRIDRP